MARCFIAVKLGEEIEAQLEQLQTKAKQLPIASSFPKEFHCTLVFLGEKSEAQVEEIKLKLSSIAFPPAEVEVKGVGFFPNENFVRVFWAGVKGLDGLQRKIADALGYKERFSGHVTIARIKAPENLGELKSLAKSFENKEFGKTTIEEFALYKSTLSPQGPHYEILLSKKLSSA